MLVPAMQSIGTRYSSSTLITPTCAAPRAPPPGEHEADPGPLRRRGRLGRIARRGGLRRLGRASRKQHRQGDGGRGEPPAEDQLVSHGTPESLSLAQRRIVSPRRGRDNCRRAHPVGGRWVHAFEQDRQQAQAGGGSDRDPHAGAPGPGARLAMQAQNVPVRKAWRPEYPSLRRPLKSLFSTSIRVRNLPRPAPRGAGSARITALDLPTEGSEEMAMKQAKRYPERSTPKSPPLRHRKASMTLCALLSLALLAPPPALAQTAAPAQAQASAPSAVFKDEELDQMLAPIALYPDALLAQILMASTYPAEVKEAADWSKAHPDTKGDDAIKQVENQALGAVGQVAGGVPAGAGDDGRQARRRAAAGRRLPRRPGAGDGPRAVPAHQGAGGRQPEEQRAAEGQHADRVQQAGHRDRAGAAADGLRAGLPAHRVYGTWWYPSYPPYYWPPPAYYYPGAAFVGGVLWGAAVVGIANGLWGGCNWGRGDVNINVNRYNNVNVNNKISANDNTFKHNAEGRRDVPYRDSKSREQYGNKGADGARDREAYRGKDNRDADRARAESTLKERGADPAAGRQQMQGADRAKVDSAVRDADRSRDTGGAGRGDVGASSRDASRGSTDFGGAWWRQHPAVFQRCAVGREQSQRQPCQCRPRTQQRAIDAAVCARTPCEWRRWCPRRWRTSLTTGELHEPQQQDVPLDPPHSADAAAGRAGAAVAGAGAGARSRQPRQRPMPSSRPSPPRTRPR